MAGKPKNTPRDKFIMKVSLNDLEKTSSKFRQASRETHEIMGGIEKAVKELEETWEDAGKQVFFKYFQEWQAHISGVTELLNIAANELDAVAERYLKADGDIPPEVEDR